MGLKMRADEMKRMYLAVCRTLINKEKMLCELDSYIGDGDHGTTVARGIWRSREKTDGKGIFISGGSRGRDRTYAGIPWAVP